jgi:hypothetical protein
MCDEDMTSYVGTRREGGYDVIFLAYGGREGREDPLPAISIGVANKPTREGGAESGAVVGAEVGLLNTDYLVGLRVVFNVSDDILPTNMARGRVNILGEAITIL